MGAFNSFNKSGSKEQRTLGPRQVAERKGGICWDFFPRIRAPRGLGRLLKPWEMLSLKMHVWVIHFFPLNPELFVMLFE